MSFAGVAKGAGVWGPKAAKAGKMAGKLIPGISEAIGWIEFASDVGTAIYDWATPPGGPSSPPPGGAQQSGGAGVAQQVTLEDVSWKVNTIISASLVAHLTAGTDPVEEWLVAHSGDIMNGVEGALSYAMLKSWQAQNAASGAAAAANNAKDEAEGVRAILLNTFISLSFYPLDEEGLTDFRQDRADGKIAGQGLVLLRDDGVTGEFLPILNPEMLTLEAAGGSWAVPTLEVIADMLAGLKPRPPHV